GSYGSRRCGSGLAGRGGGPVCRAGVAATFPAGVVTLASNPSVYTITNAASGNAVLAFHRAANGALTPAGTFPTGGTGTGGGARLRPLTRGLQGWQSARRRERRQQHGFGLQGRSRRLRLIGSPV